MTSPSDPRSEGKPVSGAMTSKGFRLDVQGIRGMALILVLACHAEIPAFEGGFVALDIFYVLSGFLITGLILTEIERRGTVSLLNFYARRAKRLLPLAVTVLIVILIGSIALFSTVRQAETAGDVIAAALYFVNWRFIAQEVDYFASGEGDFSPVQHYWSLSVEEQFYIVWPMALLLISLLAFRSGWSIRRSMWIFVAPLGLSSLIYCLIYTPMDPDAAYFSTLTRIWQLAAGAALTLTLPMGFRRMPLGVSALLTIAGVGTILASTALFNETDPYPGWRGILPVAGTMAVLIAGTATRVSGPIRLLCQRPFQYLGKISYAYYLWHWPAIVFAVAFWGEMNPFQLSLVVLAAGVPAIISHYLIEERFRRSPKLNARPKTAVAIGASFTVVAVVLAVGIRAGDQAYETAPEQAVAGALAIEAADGTRKRARLQREADAIRPNPLLAREDRGRAFEDDCLLLAPATEPPDCVYGDPDSDVTVALIGDSHALQYSPTFIRLAEENGWRLELYMRAACVIAIVDYKSGCLEWLEIAFDEIAESEPHMVVMSTGTTSRYKVFEGEEQLSRDESQPYLVDGFRETSERLLETGAEVVLIRDQARSPFIVHECVAEAPADLGECAFEPTRIEKNAFDVEGIEGLDVSMIDPMPILCPDNLCHGVMGNALVYRDSYHLSATFARTLAPWVQRRLPDIPKPAKQGERTRT